MAPKEEPGGSIENICREHLGVLPSKITRLTTGLFNKSFTVTFDDQVISSRIHPEKKTNRMVIRIAPPDDAGFIFYEKNMMWQEPEIHEALLENTSVPVPEILAADFTREIIDRDYLLMEFLEGTPLSQAHFLNSKALARVYYQTGEFLNETHGIHFKEYGYRGKHSPCPTRDSWLDAFELMWNYLQDDLVGCKAYSKEEANEYRTALESRKESFNRDVSSSLLHMDVWSQNILVDKDGNVTGLVDWDRSLCGDPEIEFSVCDYCGITNQAFWLGYKDIPEVDENYEVRMKFYLLYEHQKYIVINVKRKGDVARANHYKRDSRSILQSLP